MTNHMRVGRVRVGVWAACFAVAAAGRAGAASVELPLGADIQAAVDAARPGDEILLGEGTWSGDLDFRGKAIAVRGRGRSTVIVGTATGPVVRFVSGEPPAAVLDGVTVTGGLADDGGGILVRDASPTIVRTVVTGNRAYFRGSGIHLERSAATLLNNVVSHNGSAGGDPHAIDVAGGSPAIVNNTIAYGDSNGIIVRPGSTAVIRNNILARNGSRPAGEDARGRGICDFGRDTVIQYNLFHRNRRAALLSADFTDYRRIARAERALQDPRLANNRDGSPRFLDDDTLALHPFSRARHAGDPDPAVADRDGARNTLGHTGGPFAAP